MSRMPLRLLSVPAGLCVLALLSSAAAAQDTYGPVLDEEESESAPPLTETRRTARQCETQTEEDGIILVCRELDDDEAYRSPLPAPTASDRTIIPGLTDPPCWVTNPSAVGTPTCMRFGYVPPPAIIVDLTQYPEPLDEADAALVSEIEAPEAAEPTRRGERIPIDLSEDE